MESIHFRSDITQHEPFIDNLFLMSDGGKYMLGHSKNPSKRIEELRNDNLRLVACCPMMNGVVKFMYDISGLSTTDWIELSEPQINDTKEAMRASYYKYKYTKYPISSVENKPSGNADYKYSFTRSIFPSIPEPDLLNKCIGKNGTFLKHCNVNDLSGILIKLGVKTNVEPIGGNFEHLKALTTCILRVGEGKKPSKDILEKALLLLDLPSEGNTKEDLEIFKKYFNNFNPFIETGNL